MFKRRLLALLALWAAGGSVLIARMVDLQVVNGERYRRAAEDLLISAPHDLPPARGRILDRRGRVLAADQPAWHLALHYGLLAGDESYLRSLARRLGVGLADVRRRARDCWALLSELTGQPIEDLRQRAERIVRRVRAIRDDFRRRNGYDAPVREERMAHPIVRAVDSAVAVRARLAQPRFPMLFVQRGHRRVYHDSPALGHLIGRLGEVRADDLANDPLRDDPLAGYIPGDLRGISGAERLGEHLLRGRRGLVVEDADGHIVLREEPRRGDDLSLTIDLDLQQRIYDRLEGAVAETPTASGAAAVVLDIRTREILALVSYPGFPPGPLGERFDELASDSLHQPLLFRAVQGQYPPGSTVKPVVAAAALALGTITPHTTITCRGYLFPEHPDRWRCWQAHGTSQPMQHGPLDPEHAIEHSCNIFFYTVGQMLGPDTIGQWFGFCGLGRSPRTGLLRERPGLVPDADWLWKHRRRRFVPADGRNFALGQGEILATPLQVANMMATLATGRFTFPVLARNSPGERPVWELPADADVWAVVRRGLWRVVNDRAGTAYRTACLHRSDYELCGKTGSAQTSLRIVEYEVVLRRGGEPRVLRVPATTRAEARAAAARRLRCHPADLDIESLRPIRYWPWQPGEREGSPAHAWFAGIIQPALGRPGVADPRIALAVFIEYGMSGGRAAAPVARDIAIMLIEDFPELLDSRAAPPVALSRATP